MQEEEFNEMLDALEQQKQTAIRFQKGRKYRDAARLQQKVDGVVPQLNGFVREIEQGGHKLSEMTMRKVRRLTGEKEPPGQCQVVREPQ